MEVQNDPRFQVDIQFNFEPSQEQRDRLIDIVDRAIKETVGDIQKGCIFIHYEPGKVRQL